jgi:Ni/Fe-hydrogenase 1 B-type cytochrome subunit
MEKLVTKYVWEWPVRIVHWVNFLAILTLSVTGIYIGSPKTLALNPSQYVMGWIRFVHFVAGYVFAISVLSRIYWAFKGNEYANWRIFVPYLFKDGRKNMKETFLFYTFFKAKAPHVTGHNALAGSVYLVIFLLYLVMIFTGFALYSQYAPDSLMHGAFGWLFSLFSNQGVRLTHHIVMWLLLAFAIHHVYSAWLMDVKEKNGVMSSIFGGYKSVPAGGEH